MFGTRILHSLNDAAMKRLRLNQREGIVIRIGDRGRTEAGGLHPHGFVSVNGQRHEARAEFGAAESGDEIVVVGGGNLGLLVRKVSPGEKVSLKNQGEQVFASFLEKMVTETGAVEESRHEENQRRLAFAVKAGAAAGFFCAALGLGFTWEYVRAECPPPWQYVTPVVVLVVGLALGVGVAFGMHGFLKEIDPDCTRLTLPSAGLALAGTTTGAVLGIHFAGFTAGLVAAIVGTFLLGLLVPGFLMLVQWFGGD